MKTHRTEAQREAERRYAAKIAMVSVKMRPELKDELDEVRGDQPRNAWIIEAIEEKIRRSDG